MYNKTQSKDLFKVSMKPIEKFISFKKLKKGVLLSGSPGGLIGHTSTGDIRWLGTAEQMQNNFPTILKFDKEQNL